MLDDQNIKNLEKTKDGELLFSNIDLNLKKGDKIAVLSKKNIFVYFWIDIFA